MKLQLRLSLPAKLSIGTGDAQRVHADHKSMLADLMLAAYKGTVDDEGEGIEEAQAEISGLMDGEYGTFLDGHSFILFEKGVAVSATLVTLAEEGPLLAFSMTRAGHKRRGHAKALIAASTDSLAGAGYSSLDLWVTESNKPALALYRALGFKRV